MDQDIQEAEIIQHELQLRGNEEEQNRTRIRLQLRLKKDMWQSGDIVLSRLTAVQIDQIYRNLVQFWPEEALFRRTIVLQKDLRLQKIKDADLPTLAETAQIWWTSIGIILALYATLIIAGPYTLLQLSESDSWVKYPGYVLITALYLAAILFTVTHLYPRRKILAFKNYKMEQ